MRVLVADDDLTSRFILQEVMGRWGYEVEAVADGIAAWAALQRSDGPRLAVLDWQMPGMDGVAVCRRAREVETSEPPYLLLLTARGDKRDVVEGLRAGANDYVAKPYDNEELRARLEVGRRVVVLQAALAQRVGELEQALADVRTLRGILPICMHCHKIRTDQASWERIEKYVSDHSEAQFSHGICPDCLEKHYPEVDEAEGKVRRDERS